MNFTDKRMLVSLKVVKKVKAMRPWINVCILTPKDNEIESRKLKEFSSFNILFAATFAKSICFGG